LKTNFLFFQEYDEKIFKKPGAVDPVAPSVAASPKQDLFSFQ
jgi:hypothetical protein